MPQNKLALYKERFANSLVGNWSSIEGTFSLMSETIEFYPDGKGTWTESSGSGTCSTYFSWRINTPFVLEMLTEYMDDGTDEPEDQEDDDEEEKWIAIRYDFRIISNDCTKQIALCSNNSETFCGSITRIGLADEA